VILWIVGSASYAQDQRALMGVELDSAPLPDLLTKHLGLEVGQGVRIRNVIVGSPADEAGLERDDIIAAFQGKKVTGVEQVVEGVRGAKVGEEVSLEVIHLGQHKALKLTLAAAQEDAELKYPPEPEAMTTWRPGKIFKMGPEGDRWMEIPFDKVPDFNVDVDQFFKERRVLRHKSEGEDYTIVIEGDPRDEDSTVIVEAGDAEYRTTVGQLDALPEKYREPVRGAIKSSRESAKKDIIIEKRFRLPEPPRPEQYRGFFRSIPRPNIERFSEQTDRVLEGLQEQMERLQQRMQALEERNREMLARLLEKRDAGKQKEPAPAKPAPAEPEGGRAI
jgi:hypothetical protein